MPKPATFTPTEISALADWLREVWRPGSQITPWLRDNADLLTKLNREERFSWAAVAAALNEVGIMYRTGNLQIPMEAGRGFRFDVGHRSDLIPATLPGRPGLIGRVSNSGICPLVINHEEGRMPAKRELTMRQIRYTLRLPSEGISARQIGRMLGVARSTIQDNLKRAHLAG